MNEGSANIGGEQAGVMQQPVGATTPDAGGGQPPASQPATDANPQIEGGGEAPDANTQPPAGEQAEDGKVPDWLKSKGSENADANDATPPDEKKEYNFGDKDALDKIYGDGIKISEEQYNASVEQAKSLFEKNNVPADMAEGLFKSFHEGEAELRQQEIKAYEEVNTSLEKRYGVGKVEEAYKKNEKTLTDIIGKDKTEALLGAAPDFIEPLMKLAESLRESKMDGRVDMSGGEQSEYERFSRLKAEYEAIKHDRFAVQKFGEENPDYVKLFSKFNK